MTPKLEETIYIDFITSSSAGAATDADNTPTFEVFEDANDTALTLSGTAIAKRTSKTGNYRITLPCTASNGFEADKSYNVVASATVSTVAAKAVVARFQVRAQKPGELADGAITAAKIGSDAITAAKIAADAVTEIQAGLSTLTAAQVWGHVTRTLTSGGGSGSGMSLDELREWELFAGITFERVAQGMAVNQFSNGIVIAEAGEGRTTIILFVPGTEDEFLRRVFQSQPTEGEQSITTEVNA